jgi:DNA-binding NtrC family response regulator
MDDLPAEILHRALGSAGSPSGIPSIQIPLDQSLDAIVQRVIEAALELEGGNRSRTARRLGISLRTVQRHLTEVRTRGDSRRSSAANT